jgi:ribosomal-protein-alanine N-acetyltransferase
MSALEERKLIEIPIVDLGDIYLRAIEFKDYKDMYEYGSDTRVTRTLSWHYNTLSEAEVSITRVHLSRPKNKLPLAYAIIHKSSDKMIGTCDYHCIDWSTLTGEIGYVVHHDYWGKGYMTKACKALINFGFDYLNLQKVVISHDVRNIGSQRVIVKSGFNFTEQKLHQKNQTMNRFYEIKREEYESTL